LKPTLIAITAALFFQGVICADDKTGAPDASHYPQTQAYKEALSISLRDSDILAIAAFAGGGGFFLFYRVDKNGQEFDVRDVPNWAMQASHSKQLSNEQLKSLQLAVSDLPEDNSYGDAGYLVVVKTSSKGVTKTRCYDGKNLPKAMRDIYAIIGERFETAGIK